MFLISCHIAAIVAVHIIAAIVAVVIAIRGMDLRRKHMQQCLIGRESLLGEQSQLWHQVLCMYQMHKTQKFANAILLFRISNPSNHQTVDPIFPFLPFRRPFRRCVNNSINAGLIVSLHFFPRHRGSLDIPYYKYRISFLEPSVASTSKKQKTLTRVAGGLYLSLAASVISEWIPEPELCTVIVQYTARFPVLPCSEVVV